MPIRALAPCYAVFIRWEMAHLTDTAKIFANIAKFKRVAAGLPLDRLDELPSYARVHVLAEAHRRLAEPLKPWQYIPERDIGASRSQWEAEADWNVERWARSVWVTAPPMPTRGVIDSWGNAELVETWYAVKDEMRRAGTLPMNDDIIRKKKPVAAPVDAAG